MAKNATQPIRLLESVPNKMYQRLIVRYPFQTDRDYAAAYRFAAERLASTFGGEPIDDMILLPFLTLYRQAFELQLKNIIRGLVNTRIIYVDGRTDELVQAVSKERFQGEFGHNLHKLLNEVQKHYTALDMPESFPAGVERLILMLHEADKTGTAFRYPGQLPETQEYADFPDLAALLKEQFDMLSVLEDYVDGLYSPSPTLRELENDMY